MSPWQTNNGVCCKSQFVFCLPAPLFSDTWFQREDAEVRLNQRFAKPIIRVALSLSARTHRENAASGGAELLNNFSADYCSVGIKVLSSWALWRLSGDGGVREWRRTQLALQHVSADLKACQLLLELGCGGRIYFLTGASNLVLQGHRKLLKSVQMYYVIICKICSGDHL
jgi:hypothetical protein